MIEGTTLAKDHTDNKTNHHDSGYKELFSYPEMVQALAEGFLPEAIAQMMDFETLTPHSGHYVTPLFDERIEDSVWSVEVDFEDARHTVYLYILLEFQSSVDHAMALRFMHYVAGVYSTLIKNNQIKKAGPYPPVLPLVIYNGNARWSAKTRIQDQVETMPVFLRTFQPQLEYFLLDEGRYTDDELNEINNPLSGVITVENAKTEDDYKQAFYRIGQMLRDHPKRKRIDELLTLWFRRHLQSRGVNANIQSIMAVTGDESMLAENLDNLFNQREQKGMQKGMQKGKLEGYAELIEKQLTMRFPSVDVAQYHDTLKNASDTELSQIGMQLLNAETIEDALKL
jgi:predicted transposase YdaD